MHAGKGRDIDDIAWQLVERALARDRVSRAFNVRVRTLERAFLRSASGRSRPAYLRLEEASAARSARVAVIALRVGVALGHWLRE